MADGERLRDVAVAAAEAAAAVVRCSWTDRDGTRAEVKSPGDYVTRIDREAERAALGVLAEMAPDVPVLSEEAGGALADRCWVVDPVDGTTNLIRRFPVVGVSVALVQDGAPVVGAVAAPMLGARWSAMAGGGAADGEGRALRVAASGAGVVATGFPFRDRDRRAPRYGPVLQRALTDFEDLRRPGAASLDLAYVAAGTWDGFFELGLSLWDIAAGALLVREAGGVVTDWDGDADAVFASGDILAGAPVWHERMLDITRAAAAPRRSSRSAL